MLAALTQRQVAQIGLAVAVVGAIAIAWGALSVIRGFDDRRRERMRTLVGSLLIGLGFFVQLLSFRITTTPAPTPTPTTTPGSSSSP